ncbi:MAG: hypothetical protein DHS20C13_27890 [Thermodesulfobacteriota bacterium]|nr:MAG: hypothetical protein DHS20C13_27890 [Thermodesulfobacteriota bacterium]
MSQKTKGFNQSAEPPRGATRESAAAWRDGEVENNLTEALLQSKSSSKGTPPSNTVPYNCNNTEYFKLLRFGVDSLYLSYQGELFFEVQERLTRLKLLAQHPEADQQALAQYAIGDHIFEVKDKGSSIFPFVMEDGAFRISISRSGKKTPMAYVKLSSRYLCSITPSNAEKQLRKILNELGTLTDVAHVSRIDLCADFVSSENMESWDRRAWVTRAKKMNAHAVSEKFTGWSIGMGGNISCRLYNKLLEIQTSGRTDLLPLWKAAGRTENEPVWRVEFQFMREVLAQHGLISLDSVMANLNGLWSYAATEWLRLTLPNTDDQTRARWPIHPLWGYISSIDWAGDGGPLSRSFKATRIPEDNRIFSLGASSIASYMAKHSLTDFDDGIDRYMLDIFKYFHERGLFMGLSAEAYILEKVRLRAKEFNTLLNQSEAEQKRLETLEAAKEYRKAKGR